MFLFLLPAFVQQPPAPSGFLPQADALAKQQRWSELQALGQARMGSHPKDGMGPLVVALAQVGQQHMEEALASCRRASELGPADPVIWYWRGYLEAYAGHRPEFIEANAHLGTLHREAQVSLWSLPGVFAFAAEPGSPPTVEPKHLKLLNVPGPTPFPDPAVATRLKGRVVLEVLLDAKGVPTRVRALAGHPVLAAAAERHAATWRFEPSPQGAVRMMALVPFGVPAGDAQIPFDERRLQSIYDLKILWGHEDGLK